MTQQTGNEGQKETKEIKLEQSDNMVMVMETFVLSLVKMIGGISMDNEPLTILVDYTSLRY
jgi:hypothetical protein